MKIFISHASEDKESIARPLAEALESMGYQVWYDQHTLKLGDSLSQEIDRGLVQCDYGVVILSKSFFAKHWPQRELAGLVAREVGACDGGNIILPIWHGVSRDEVAEYSPTLADRVAVSADTGLERVVSEINRVTQFISPDSSIVGLVSPKRRSAKEILANIVPAGPIQPDGGMYPEAIKAVEGFVEQWDEYGELSLFVKVEPMSREMRKLLFNEERYVFLLPTRGMHQVRVEVIDPSFRTIGMVWTPPNISDGDYHKALEFFLVEMGFLRGEMLKVEVRSAINSDDSFLVKITDVQLPQSAA